MSAQRGMASGDLPGATGTGQPAAPVDPRAVRVAVSAVTALESDPTLVVAPAPPVTDGASLPAAAGAIAVGMPPAAPGGAVEDGRPTGARLRRLDDARAILEVDRDDDGDDPEGTRHARTRVLFGPSRRGPDGGTTVREVVVDGWRLEVTIEPEVRARLRERARRAEAAGAAGGPVEVRAIIPGRVVAVFVAPGDAVVAGQQILVVEAMKMQNELRAPREGSVERVGVAVGDTIEVGDLLVVIH